jgi:ABC-2 type transport system ATP-binding protein
VSRYRVVVPGGEPERNDASALLQQHGFEVYAGDGLSLVVGADAERAADVTRALAGAGIWLAELSPVERTLEEAFFELTRDQP